MKSYLERLTVPDDASWVLLNRRLEDEIPFEWHHHPEFELTLTLNSRGQRYVGDDISPYDDGDLVLLGPNLPHTWNSAAKLDTAQPHVALVMWFRPEWAEALTGVLTELAPVQRMLQAAARGLVFSAEVSSTARPLIEAMPTLGADRRLTQLLLVLTLLAQDRPRVLTAPTAGSQSLTHAEQGRIDRILEYLHVHYSANVSLRELAAIARLSPSGLHRLFQRHTRLSVTQYVTRLRIGEACALLISTDKPIAFIADSVGYASLANFNRQFRALKGMTPRAFRGQFQR